MARDRVLENLRTIRSRDRLGGGPGGSPEGGRHPRRGRQDGPGRARPLGGRGGGHRGRGELRARAAGRTGGARRPGVPLALHRRAPVRAPRITWPTSPTSWRRSAGEHAARRLAGRCARAGRTVDVLLEVDLTGERPGSPPPTSGLRGPRRLARGHPAARTDDDARRSRPPPRRPGRGSLSSRELRERCAKTIPTCWNCPWGCRWITRSRWRKALRWCASERRCSVPATP